MSTENIFDLNDSDLENYYNNIHDSKVMSEERAKMLKMAADYIESMKRKNYYNQQKVDDLKRQNNLLESQIRTLEELKANGGNFLAAGVTATATATATTSKDPQSESEAASVATETSLPSSLPTSPLPQEPQPSTSTSSYDDTESTSVVSPSLPPSPPPPPSPSTSSRTN